MQVWVLLLNMGHLFGTFASERALLNQFKKNSNLKRTFKKGLPQNKKIIDRLDEVINEEDSYRLHEIISFFYLLRLKRGHNSEVELLVEILKYYRIDDPSRGLERVKKLRILFRKIRQVSYLFLDSHYGPVPVAFELGPILYNFEEYAKELFLAVESPLNRALESFQDLLVENFYLAPESMNAFGEHSRSLEKRIKSEEKIFKSIVALNVFLKKSTNFEIGYEVEKSDLLRLLIDERKYLFSSIPSIQPLELEEQWNEIFPKSRCQCTFQLNPKKSMLGITIALNKKIKFEDKPRLFSLIMQRVIALQDQFAQPISTLRGALLRKLMLARSFESPCKELLLFILKHLSGKDVAFIPMSSTTNPDLWFIQRGSTKSARRIRDLYKQYKAAGVDRNRLQEILTLSKALENISHHGTVLTSINQIGVIQKENGMAITDLDGVAICSDTSELSLLLVESKASGSGDAKRRLESTIKKISLDNLEYTITEVETLGAYCKVRGGPQN